MEFDYSRVFTLRVYWGAREKATLKRKERKKGGGDRFGEKRKEAQEN